MARGKGAGPIRLEKCPTGIGGLDEITGGGLPRGRPTLVCGGPGCGKTLLGMEFLVRGIRDFGEPGVFVAFEETAEDLAKNVASLGFDIGSLIRRRRLAIDYVHIERSEIEETGEYDLEGLFIRLGAMVDRVGAKRVVVDSVEALFAGLPNEAILRSELRRLFRWLKQKSLTAVVTSERGDDTLSRYGLEEYISDCVILLDHRVVNQVATRRLRVVKYRGSSHGTDEYPTMIDERGLSVLPISSMGLKYPVRKERVSTGIDRLDAMLGGRGYFKGASVLVSGTAGSGKTSVAAAFADRICSKGNRCLYFAFEESADQIVRNMASIGLDLGRHVRKGLLRFEASRPTQMGLESHLVTVHKLVTTFRPQAVVMDPLSNLIAVGDIGEVRALLTRVIDFLKNEGVTAMFTALTKGGEAQDQTEVGISSLMDTWLLLESIRAAGERNRVLHLLKSRGMAHSNQMREFVLSNKGISLVDVYLGTGEVLTGSARVQQEAKDRAQVVLQRESDARRAREIEHEEAAARAQIEVLQRKLATLEAEHRNALAGGQERVRLEAALRSRVARTRQAD